ncbi:tRNA pseudouridine(55) synthase TruB [Myxococcota bacterium]
MDGILIIDKPVGPTSHDVVDRVRNLLHQKKVGHTGTLDPVATGVLPLVLGRATKIARYLTGGDKQYRATFRLGVTTQTLDAEGEVVEERPVNAEEDSVRETLDSFVGEIQQIPPMFSAKKMHGKRLYELARQGVEVEREPKTVTIHSIDLVDLSLPDVTVDVRCSAGTYVRVLAQDTGERLGCGGHLKQLRRLAAGPFSIDEAVTLATLEADPGSASEHVLPLSRALTEMPRIFVPIHLARMVVSGHQLSVADLKALDVPDFAAEQLIALWLDDGELLAVTRTTMSSSELNSSRRDRRALKTERVLTQMPR